MIDIEANTIFYIYPITDEGYIKDIKKIYMEVSIVK